MSFQLIKMIEEQTKRALWKIKNVIDCIPDELWEKEYCEMPMYKHVYHTLHSLDLWMINPRDVFFKEPDFHIPDLNNLDIKTDFILSRQTMEDYLRKTEMKIMDYLADLDDEKLCEKPKNCEYSRLTLILAQFRHLHTHMGMLKGFIIDDTGLWPKILGLESPFPEGDFDKYL